MLGQTLIDERVVRTEQFEHASIFVDDALEEELCFLPEGTSKRLIEVGKRDEVRRDRGEIP